MKKYLCFTMILVLLLVQAVFTVNADPQVTITVQIGNEIMTVNGNTQEVDPGRGTVPVILEARTLLPIRVMIESLGGEVGWIDAEKRVTIEMDGNLIELSMLNPQYKEALVFMGVGKPYETIGFHEGSKEMTVNSETITNDVPAIIINSRTYMPLRFISENVGCEVEWEDSTKTVTVTYVGTATPTGPAPTSPPATGDNWFKHVQAIDHWNLRYFQRYDTFSLAEQVQQAKDNMDIAESFGFNSYLFFQKDAFQELLTWGGKHSADSDLQNAVKDLIAYGKTKGLGVFLHSNQFLWPSDVGVGFSDSQASWDVFENAMYELIELFPDVAGYEVTGDETAGALDTVDGLVKFHNLTAQALKSDGVERYALMRTWQRCGFMGKPAHRLGDGDEPNLMYSIKSTDGDFRIPNGLDSNFFHADVNGHYLLAEFDAWREYETHNTCPLYLGNYWEPVFKAMKEVGTENVGVRFNWNSGRMWIGDSDRKYGNWINLYTFNRLIKNPDEDPDVILTDFCNENFPEDPQAYKAMYEGTFDYIMGCYYNGGEKYLHHGGMKRKRGSPPSNAQVEDAWNAFKPKLDALPAGNQYTADVQQYGKIPYIIGSAATGNPNESDISAWQSFSPESFDELVGENAMSYGDMGVE